MRISDWSSDVCSSDLALVEPAGAPDVFGQFLRRDEPWQEQENLSHGRCAGHGAADFSRRTEPEELPERAPRPRRNLSQCDDLSLHHRSEDEAIGPVRSEEHTSELQSLMRISYAVFCLRHKKKI